MCDAVCLTGVDPNSFGLAEPLKEKNNIKTNVAHKNCAWSALPHSQTDACTVKSFSWSAWSTT